MGDNCVSIALNFCLKLKSEEQRDEKNKVLEFNLQILALNGSGFHTWTVLNNIPCDNRIRNIVKKGKGKVELKVLIGYIEKR